jgi:Zn-dependent protease
VLKFSLGDIPVRVHFTFLLIAFIFPQQRLVDTAAWVLVAFLAVLLHEAGHAFAARHYGATPVTITLFALGGVTVYPAVNDLTPGRRLVISAMGSIVGILTGGVLLLVWWSGVFDNASNVVQVAVVGYMWAALGWGVLNWIPVRPLDGGAMLTSFLEIVWPSRALIAAKTISLISGVGVSLLLWRWGQTFGAFFILLITAMGLAGGNERTSREETRHPDRPQQPEVVEPADSDKRTVTERPEDPPAFPI